MIIGEQEKPSLASLSHVGVKGMKWGVRKAKVTTGDIHGARERQSQRHRELQRADDVINTTSGKTRSAALKKAAKLAIDIQTNEDRVTAARITKGEAAIHVLMLGPLAAITLPARALGARSTRKSVDELRKKMV